jgi:hypothetical protein
MAGLLTSFPSWTEVSLLELGSAFRVRVKALHLSVPSVMSFLTYKSCSHLTVQLDNSALSCKLIVSLRLLL